LATRAESGRYTITAENVKGKDTAEVDVIILGMLSVIHKIQHAIKEVLYVREISDLNRVNRKFGLLNDNTKYLHFS
jgi:hypothetical protein